MLLGSVITAAGLQFFLIPNHLLDGGVTGLSIISAYLSGLPLGLFLVVFNLPFIYLGYKKLGKEFAAYSTLGILVLALITLFVHPQSGVTDQPILAAVFGGLLVGVGVGIAIRYGGTLDGADTVAILIDKVTLFTIGEAIMLMNAIILTGAGVVFGWDNAMYSLIAYFVAHKAIDVTIEGFDESRSVWVVSRRHEDIGRALRLATGKKVTYFKGDNHDGGEHKGIILAVITRLEEPKVKSLIQNLDSRAFIVISSAHEIISKDSET